ncbi:alpha/beta hydrolase family protein [Paenibacillus pinistramenti]|uniref:alpha/beta hydrolase family protein n=1 Tax=Paenibacillus pinistramenti TaxID=1768003 RepID=UPI00110801E7|nr:prolyl oligopeptidase family serine peptidase [Paenibacillus pinistramenti]
MQSLYNQIFFEENLHFVGLNKEKHFVYIQSEENNLSLISMHEDDLITLFEFGELDGAIHYLFNSNLIAYIYIYMNELIMQTITLEGEATKFLKVPLTKFQEPILANVVEDKSRNSIFLLIEDLQEKYWFEVDLSRKFCLKSSLEFQEMEVLNSEQQALIYRVSQFPENDLFFWYSIAHKKKVEIEGNYICSNALFICTVVEAEEGAIVNIYRWDSLQLFKTFPFSDYILDARFLSSSHLALIQNCNGIQKLLLLNLNNNLINSVPNIKGRLDISNIQKSNICLHKCSILEGSEWIVCNLEGIIARKQGIERFIFMNESYTHGNFLVHRPKGLPKRAFISLHGGPESCEYDELRYWGLYRELLRDDVLVLVLNYQGSANFGFKYRSSPWNNWLDTFSKELEHALEYLKITYGLCENLISIFGVSFGGALALASPVINSKINSVIAVAPLVSLEKHVAKLESSYPEMVSWFKARFYNKENRYFFSEKFHLKNKTVPVTIIQGDHDEILSFQNTTLLVNEARELGMNWSLVIEKGVLHYPVEVEQCRTRLQNIKEAFLAYLDTSVN